MHHGLRLLPGNCGSGGISGIDRILRIYGIDLDGLERIVPAIYFCTAILAKL
jgi:hypothetical protein